MSEVPLYHSSAPLLKSCQDSNYSFRARGSLCGKVDVRLPGKVNSNSHDTRPIHLIITMIKWIRTSRLSMKNSLVAGAGLHADAVLSLPAARLQAVEVPLPFRVASVRTPC